MTSDVQNNRIERRKLEFREKITNAALKLFEQHGVAETSVAAIIVEADIAHKTFFNHFPSKDHLLQHIVNSYSTHAYSVFRQGFKKHTDPRKRIEYCFTRIASALDSLSPHYKELMNFYLISGAGGADLHAQQRVEFMHLVNQIIDEADAASQLRPGFKPDMLGDMVAGLCLATLLNWSVEENYPLPSKMKSTVKFLNASVFL